jgi:acyl transferase domain-containing protein/acyl carrier protein
MTKDKLRHWMMQNISATLKVEVGTIDPSKPFAELGLDSKTGLEMLGKLQEFMSKPIDPAAIYEFPSINLLASALDDKTRPSAPQAGRHTHHHAPIAIVGIGCRLPPSVRGPDEFWAFLERGESAIRPAPEQRVKLSSGLEGCHGGWLDSIDAFDCQFFGISPKEADAMDPQQRLMLEVSWDALEDAFINPDLLRGTRTGFFIGLSTNEYAQHQPSSPEPHSITGNAPSIAANRLSYFYDAVGPSITVDTACSSSLTAVDLACTALRAGDAEIALAGGANVILSPRITMAFEKAGMMAEDGRCKTFDDRADGYVRGEGAALVVLKTLDKALTDGDRIYSVILSTELVQDGRSNGLMAPNVSAQIDVIAGACRKAGVDPASISYLEAHGTGTHLGDMIELTAIGRTVGASSRSENCRIGSVKTNIGHLEAAAGVAGLIKTALCLYNDRLVGSLNFETPNHRLKWEEFRIQVQLATSDLPAVQCALPESLSDHRLDFADRDVHLAGVSSFGFGGMNVHAILASPPRARRPHAADNRDAGLTFLPLSAGNEQDLRGAAAAYSELLTRADQAEVSRICDAALNGRAHGSWRMAFPLCATEGIKGAVDAFAQTGKTTAIGPSKTQPSSNLIFVFTGQGSQWSGMGQRLFSCDPVFADEVVRLSDLVRNLRGWSPIEVMFSPDKLTELAQTEFAQPVIFILQIALAKSLERRGFRATAVVGHSLGEITALCHARMLTTEQAIRLVIERARAMEVGSGRGAMLAVRGQSRKDIELLLKKQFSHVAIAADNSSDSLVLSGMSAEIAKLAEFLKRRGIAAKLLPSSYAFHNPETVAADEDYLAFAREIPVVPPAVTVYSTVTGRALNINDVDNRQYWLANIQNTVEFRKAVGAAIADGMSHLVEIGPQPVLSTHIDTIARDASANVNTYHLLKQGADEAREVCESLASMFVNGALITPDNTARKAHTRPARLPLSAWHRTDHWQQRSTRESNQRGAFLDPPIHIAGGDSIVFIGSVDPESHRFLEGHRLREVSVFPASGFIELFLEATSAIGASTLSEIKFPNLLPLSERSIELQLILNTSGESHLAAIHARLGVSRWRLCATAKLSKPSSTDIGFRLDGDQIRGRCFNYYRSEPLYAMLLQKGYNYGSAFRLVNEIWFSENEAIGFVGTKASGKPNKFLADPALVDACFHVASVLLPSAEQSVDGMFLPVAVEELRFIRSPSGSVQAYAGRVSFDAQSFTVNITVQDDSGCCMELRGLRLARRGATKKKARSARPPMWFYQPYWRTAALPPVVLAARGRWLIFGDRAGLGIRIAKNLRRRGCTVIMASPASIYEQTVDGFRLDFTDPQQTTRMLTSNAMSEQLDHVLFTTALDESSGSEAIETDALAVMNFIQAYFTTGKGTPPDLNILTRLSQPLENYILENPRAAMLWGFAKAIPFEHSNVRCRRLDLGPAYEDDVNVPILVELLLSDHGEDQFAIRNGALYVTRLRLKTVEELPIRTPVAMENGTVVVSGGTGALGLQVALALVESGAKKIALLSRSAPDGEQIAAIRQLQEQGEVKHFICDLSDKARTELVLSDIKAAMGTIQGVVHLAGVLDDGAIRNFDAARLRNVLRAKVLGAERLFSALSGQALDFFILFSSAAAILGSPGQSAYMAANAMLDAFAHYLRALGVPAMSINWGPWGKAGMAARSGLAETRLGQLITMIEPEAGRELFSELLERDVANLTVLPFDVKPLVQFYPVRSGIYYFEDLLSNDLNAIRSDGGEQHVQRRPNLRRPYRPPSSDMERKLCDLWGRSLGMKDIGVDDEFFELGGDSVFASQLLAEINEAFAVQLDLERAYEKLTIAQLALLIDEQLAGRRLASEHAVARHRSG